MASKSVSLGSLIKQVDVRNRDNRYSLEHLRGVDKNKTFIKTVASTDSLDLSNYKVIKTGQFVYSGMQTGRDKCIRVALNAGDAIIVSPAYSIFEVRDEDEVLPEYLMLFFTNSEIDRIGWYKSDSSVRANLDWDRFCEIEIPLPSLAKQREYVAIYRNLQRLTAGHENSFADLQLVSDTFTEKLASQYGTEELGAYISQTDTRNRDLAVQKVQGVSIQKKFIDSKANMDGVPLGGYKIVKPGQFAYVTVTSRNGQKISLALNDSDEPHIVSSTYISFEVIDTTKLLPEFLLLWFKRAEFDRYARYNSWGSARETFDWSEMQRVQLPVPPLSVQRSIVAIHHALQTRKRLTERLRQTIKDISPVLIKNAKDSVEATL